MRGDYHSETMKKEKNKPENIISIAFPRNRPGI
jgi:hypothetical protein